MSLFILANAGPSFAFFNKVDGGRAYIGNDGQRVGWNTKAQGFANVDHLSLRKFVSGLFFSTQINKTRFPFMFSVLRQSNPLKIFWPVVRFDAVDVVDGKVRLVPIHKTHCNQSVNKNFWPFAIFQCRHHQIPVAVQKRGKFDGWKIAGKSLFNAIADTLGRAGSCLVPNASVLVNKPRNAFFNNFYWVHSVNTIAGHSYKCKPVQKQLSL